MKKISFIFNYTTNTNYQNKYSILKNSSQSSFLDFTKNYKIMPHKCLRTQHELLCSRMLLATIHATSEKHCLAIPHELSLRVQHTQVE